jgi:mono/diheme cytochrome c family protein
MGELADALDFRIREDYDRVQDAVDPGELLEHASLDQSALASGNFDLDSLFVFGDELFEYEFRPENGLGNGLAGRDGIPAGDRAAPNLRRVHAGEFGGPDSFNCATCHLKGGPDGAGNNTQNAFFRSDGDSSLEADERNPPQVIGLGPIQALAAEMSRELQAQESEALLLAERQGLAVVAPLESKGIPFGELTAHPNGSVELRPRGVDRDLLVRPFGWKGHQATLRGIIEESFRIQMGIVSSVTHVLAAEGSISPEIVGDGPDNDIDNDGVLGELDDGMVSTVVAYLSQLEAPVVIPPRTDRLLEHFADGAAVFEDVGCADCHRPYLVLHDPVIRTRAEHPFWSDSPPLEIDVARDGEHPKIEAIYSSPDTPYRVHLFSDLKRHDMGESLASPGEQAGIPATVWLTRPLWGLAETAPYLHDGRAPTVNDAILGHGGEGAGAREAYAARSDYERASLQIYLLSLTRQPKLSVP